MLVYDELIGIVNEDDKRLLRLKFHEGLTYEKIGKIYGKSKQTMNERVHNIIKRIRVRRLKHDQYRRKNKVRTIS